MNKDIQSGQTDLTLILLNFNYINFTWWLILRKCLYFSYCNDTHLNTGFFLRQQVQQLIPDLIQPQLFCAGSDGSGLGSCEGDSGNKCSWGSGRDTFSKPCGKLGFLPNGAWAHLGKSQWHQLCADINCWPNLFLSENKFLKVDKRLNLFVKVCHRKFHDILPKESSGIFSELLWGEDDLLSNEMTTNNKD